MNPWIFLNTLLHEIQDVEFFEKKGLPKDAETLSNSVSTTAALATSQR
jgi:hypothetical protein